MIGTTKWTIPWAVAVGVAVPAALIANSQEASNGKTPMLRATGPLVARGYTETPAGTVMIANNPNGGTVLKELRIREGQFVKRGEIIAVMSNYDSADIGVKIAENDLRKTERVRDTVLNGTWVTNIQLVENALKSAIQSDKLSTMRRERSGKPSEEKQLEVWLADQSLKNQRDSLELNRRERETALKQNPLDIAKLKAAIDHASVLREEALVRSPIDGIVVQINSRQGEIASHLGIAKVVDMKQLRVFATLDEVHLPRLKPGAPVEITFRGSPTTYRGKIALAPMTVKREKRSEADLGVANVRQVEVEIAPDEDVTFPQMLGREARVTFL